MYILGPMHEWYFLYSILGLKMARRQNNDEKDEKWNVEKDKDRFLYEKVKGKRIQAVLMKVFLRWLWPR